MCSGIWRQRAIDANYATAAINATYDYYDSQIVSSATDINHTKTSDQAEVDARVAYYIARANADHATTTTTLSANTAALNRRLDLLLLWSQHVVDESWYYDTVKYGGYDGLTYSMIDPNHSYNITYTAFTGGAVTTGTRYIDGGYVNGKGRIEPWRAFYDEFGRLKAKTDYNALNIKD